MTSSDKDIPDFCGIEFDWFAVDAAGAIGLFSTGGWGEIPVGVARHAQYHQQLVAQLVVPDWGAMEIWNDLARNGLYVFDWQPYEGPYLQLAQPPSEPDRLLKNTILQLPDLLKLPANFHATTRVAVADFIPFR